MDSSSKCPFTMKSTENQLPFDQYEAMRHEGDVRWDSSMSAWVVTSYEACRDIFKNDKVMFRHPDGDSDGDYSNISEGRRALKTLEGEEHRRLHHWLLTAFSPKFSAEQQKLVVGDVITWAIKNIPKVDRINLLSDFVDKIPVRVIAAAMDLPWRDDKWIGSVQANLNQLAAFFNRRMTMEPGIMAAGKEATVAMRKLLDPFIEGRKSGKGDDLISKLWRDGPSLVSNWTAEDVFVHVNTIFLGGFDTSTLAISNGLYLLLTKPQLRDRIRNGSEDDLERFIEETLRLLPPIHYRARRANTETEIAGVKIEVDQYVIPLLASANRDEKHFPSADQFDFARAKPRDHLTFIAGPRSCIGAGLARMEIAEVLKQFMDNFPQAKLSSGADHPSYLGMAMRRFSPIFVDLR